MPRRAEVSPQVGRAGLTHQSYSARTMQVSLITGFLGSGKTTALKHLLRTLDPTTKLGVIVNDLSDLDVDGEVISHGHRVSEANGTLIPLRSGSISSRRRDEFAGALLTMHARGIDHLLIEPSGGSDPWRLIEEIRATPGAALHAVLAMVDARALHHDFGNGADLLGSRGEDLLAGQIRAATSIGLSKVDLISDAALEQILQSLRTLNPTAKIKACAYGKIAAECVSEAPPYTLAHGATVFETGELGIETTVVRDPRPLHPQRFHEHYHERLGLGILRSKGFIWFASRSSDVLLFNQAGGAIGLEFLGLWRAAVIDAGGLLPEELVELRRSIQTANPVFGARCNELTVIGGERDREIFCAGLMDCFCTASEVAQWRRGNAFVDPWPKNIRSVA